MPRAPQLHLAMAVLYSLRSIQYVQYIEDFVVVNLFVIKLLLSGFECPL